jgi:FtsZ-binding cell division protein ZapB
MSIIMFPCFKQLQSVVHKAVAHSSSLEEEIKTLKETTEKAVREKEEAQCRVDKDRAELCATLEKYKVKMHCLREHFFASKSSHDSLFFVVCLIPK